MIKGMNSDNEPYEHPNNSARMMPNQRPKKTPQEAARDHAERYSGADINKVLEAWQAGYYFGSNEAMERFQNYIAMQPPQPITVKTTEISLSTYKMFIREKIKKDSNGSLWIKINLWCRFIFI